MPISDKFSTTLFSTPRTLEPVLPEREPLQSQPSERLTLELDFARISHQSNTTSQSHPHVLFSPIHYEPGYAYPLLVWLHGSNCDERQVMRVMPEISMRNYVAVAPRGLTISSEPHTPINTFDVHSILQTHTKDSYDWWLDTDEKLAEVEQRVFDCVAIAKERCNIASDRIFLAGLGNGGTMALRLALLYPENFAGAASLDGAFPKDERILHRWEDTRLLSVFLAVGQSSTDFSTKSVCQILELLHTAGIAIKFREYPNNGLTPAMLQDLNRWMMDIVCA
jgi:phospholipase/carboxylesterase